MCKGDGRTERSPPVLPTEGVLICPPLGKERRAEQAVPQVTDARSLLNEISEEGSGVSASVPKAEIRTARNHRHSGV